MQQYLLVFSLILSLFICSPALAWHDATHMAVMKAVGLDDYAYLAVGPDMAKEKSGGYEDGNHYRGNPKGIVVTPDMVLDQVRDYNCRCNDEGHLYGAIIAALNQYRERKNVKGKHARYPLGFAGHYIADLSMPLHNTVYNDFNKAWHSANDGAVEGGENEPTDARVARIAAGILERMSRLSPYRFPSAKDDPAKFNLELAKKIAEIANRAMALGYAMQEANPQKTVMNSDEAYGQLAESAALLKAAFSAQQ